MLLCERSYDCTYKCEPHQKSRLDKSAKKVSGKKVQWRHPLESIIN